MADAKKEVKKQVKKAILKITKSNGRVIFRESLKGIKELYVAKGYKVEEE